MTFQDPTQSISAYADDFHHWLATNDRWPRTIESYLTDIRLF